MYCKKIVIRSLNGKDVVLYGIVLKTTNGFIKFKTRSKSYLIPKDQIVLVESTNIKFEGDNSE